MNSEEFYSQVNSYIEKGKRSFNDHQIRLINILKDLHTVCEEENVPYQLACGTLLGAIRDDSLIPWDSDVDVIMFSKDRKRLINILNKRFKNIYSIDCIENNYNYESYKIRIGKLGVSTLHVHIDIFLLTPIYDNFLLNRLCKWIILRCVGTRMFQTGNIKFNLNNSKDKRSWFLRKIMYGLIPLSIIDKIYFLLNDHLNNIKSNYNFYMSADIWANGHPLKKAIIDQTEVKEFSFGSFRVPIDYDTLLRSLYGEYKNYPSISNRIIEWIRGVDWIG